MLPQHTHKHTKKIVTQHIWILKFNFNEKVLEIPLVAQNPHIFSMAAMINSRLPSSCLFSESWITIMWPSRLPSNPLLERIIKNTLRNYSCFFFLFFSQKKKINKSEQESSFFLSKKDENKGLSKVIRKLKLTKL